MIIYGILYIYIFPDVTPDATPDVASISRYCIEYTEYVTSNYISAEWPLTTSGHVRPCWSPCQMLRWPPPRGWCLRPNWNAPPRTRSTEDPEQGSASPSMDNLVTLSTRTNMNKWPMPYGQICWIFLHGWSGTHITRPNTIQVPLLWVRDVPTSTNRLTKQRYRYACLLAGAPSTYFGYNLPYILEHLRSSSNHIFTSSVHKILGGCIT